MSVGKIALGVFLGNLAFALLAWVVITITAQNADRAALHDGVQQEYRALQSRQSHTP